MADTTHTRTARIALATLLGVSGIAIVSWTIATNRTFLPARSLAAPITEDARVPLRNNTSDDLRIRVDLNTADAARLQLLPGIGPSLANRIVEDRLRNGVFRSIDDLDRVRGIGSRTIERLRDDASVQKP